MTGLLREFGQHTVYYAALLAALILAAACFLLYVRERRRVKRAVSEAEGELSFFRAFALDEKNCYLYFAEDDLSLRHASPNFTRMTGLPVDEVGEDVLALRRIVSPQAAREAMRLVGNWDKAETLELDADYHPLGSDAERRARITLFHDPENAGYVVSLSDVTADYQRRRKLEKDLLAAQRASQAKSDFLSQMSHEIRTPMNGIIGLLQLAQERLDDTKAVGEYLERTSQLSQFLLTLINDILDMSRIESGKMELEQAPFDLGDLADKLDVMFRGTIEARGVRYEVKLQDLSQRWVIGDELRLSQVIINFISNANKFTSAGGTVSVTFRQMELRDGQLHLMIRVRDTGRGIRKDFISKIFRPFEQEDASTAHNYGGSGLGMAIADQIVRLMGGQILVESEEGKGTEFVVYLSLPAAEAPAEAQAVPGGQAGEKTISEEELQEALQDFQLAGLRILLAEDNDINAEIAMEILELEDVKVTRAANGAEAVQLFREGGLAAYDVILMDIQMPILDGWGAAQEIRAGGGEGAQIPIFAMSANAFAEDRRKSLQAGMNGHFNKPVDYEEVRQGIGDYLLRHGWKGGAQ